MGGIGTFSFVGSFFAILKHVKNKIRATVNTDTYSNLALRSLVIIFRVRSNDLC